MTEDLFINDTLIIPASLLTWRAVRASGPGGQHVNKVSSKVELEFVVGSCDLLDAEVRTRLRRLAGSRLTTDDRLIIGCQISRSQHQNLFLAREKLAELIRRALRPPTPRKPTRPSRGAKERRLQTKRLHAEKKRRRSVPPAADD